MLAITCLITAGFLLGTLFNVLALAASCGALIVAGSALALIAPIGGAAWFIASGVLLLQLGYAIGLSASALFRAFAAASIPSSRR